jgi:hypothetical protein
LEKGEVMGMAKLYLRYRTAEGKQSSQRPALYDKKKRLRPGWCVVDGREEHHPEAIYSERYRDENGKWRWRSHGNDDSHRADRAMRVDPMVALKFE